MMEQNMKLHPVAQQLFSNRSAMAQLAESADSKRLCQLLNQSAGGQLEQIARQALKGDCGSLLNLIGSVLETDEGGKLAQRLGTRMK